MIYVITLAETRNLSKDIQEISIELSIYTSKWYGISIYYIIQSVVLWVLLGTHTKYNKLLLKYGVIVDGSIVDAVTMLLQL